MAKQGPLFISQLFQRLLLQFPQPAVFLSFRIFIGSEGSLGGFEFVLFIYLISSYFAQAAYFRGADSSSIEIASKYVRPTMRAIHVVFYVSTQMLFKLALFYAGLR